MGHKFKILKRDINLKTRFLKKKLVARTYTITRLETSIGSKSNERDLLFSQLNADVLLFI